MAEEKVQWGGPRAWLEAQQSGVAPAVSIESMTSAGQPHVTPTRPSRFLSHGRFPACVPL